MVLGFDEVLHIGRTRYWCQESRDPAFQKRVFVEMQGTIPPSLTVEDSPMALDWDSAAITVDDTATWPPMNELLSDLTVYKILKSNLSLRDRNRCWPKGFQTGGHIIMDRPNMGPAANVEAKGISKDVVYRSSYTLHGDLGAERSGKIKFAEDWREDRCRLWRGYDLLVYH